MKPRYFCRSTTFNGALLAFLTLFASWASAAVTFVTLGVVGASVAWFTPASWAADVDFAQQIAPLFEKHCGRCHGAGKQEGGLRLDQRAAGLKGGDNYAPAIKPGKSSESPLFQFVSQADADLKMPPKGPGLSGQEIELVKQWIDQGAAWPADAPAAVTQGPRHWSFQPLRRPLLAGAVSPGSAGQIDELIARELAANQLAPAPEADRATLIRRVYLVMLGLPPTPEETAAFAADTEVDAWSRLVDRVLASPRYGERWAQHWLDLVRFGETNGFETNRERTTAWHYRDYVIDAFNSDKPYDAFVREQIAGDVTGNGLGTGFLVAGPYDLVKSQDVNLTLMQRQDELADMINTTGTAFLGLTIGCARCHNHKFDPITQRDFYALQAVFAGVQHAERALPIPPRRAERLAMLDRQIEQLARQLVPFVPIASNDTPPGDATAVDRPKRPPFREPVQARENIERLAPIEARLLRFTILATNSSEPCLDELEVYAGSTNVALATRGTKARCSSALPGYPIHKLEHINDAQHGNTRSWISNEPGGGWVELEFPRVETIDRVVWGRDRNGQFRDRVATRYRLEVATEAGKWRQVASSDDRLPPSDATASPAQPVYRFDQFPAEVAERGRKWLRELEAARRDRTQLAANETAYLGTFQQPGPTHRLFRGDPLAPREEVGPDTISLLGKLDLPAAAPERDRRDKFAQWLARDENPLTARVWANRLWQFQFGRGLVDTPNDFGANGIPPSHPQLLDTLASELIEREWSTKHVQRQLLLSATWRQDSRPTPAGLAADAGCRLWWRYPPRRLEGEAIRDSVLAASGMLDYRNGGPGFDGFDVQYENVRHYFPKTSFGPQDWRRMIYMKKVRMEKEATFGAFDCPDASQAVARRTLSTTPLQALNLLNSDFMQLQAGLLAERLEREAGADAVAQARRAYWLCWGREPHVDECSTAAEFIAAQGLRQFCRAVFNSNEFLFIP